VSTTAKSEVKSEIIVERLRRLSNNSKVDNNLIFSDPELPTLPEALKNTNSDCIFWQYIHAKPLAVETVREQINELCVENSTETNNGWCEIALNLVVKQFGSNTIKSINLDEELIEKIDFKFYIHFTKVDFGKLLECLIVMMKRKLRSALFVQFFNK
ncbi:hypothetical protein Mgra_00005185, partial [Meloidogyne graminicola]